MAFDTDSEHKGRDTAGVMAASGNGSGRVFRIQSYSGTGKSVSDILHKKYGTVSMYICAAVFMAGHTPALPVI